jgi:hypothetical protein
MTDERTTPSQTSMTRRLEAACNLVKCVRLKSSAALIEVAPMVRLERSAVPTFHFRAMAMSLVLAGMVKRLSCRLDRKRVGI